MVGVRNVYNSRCPLPPGESITQLRIWQVLSKTEPLESRPRIGAGHQKGAKACLGTVPVNVPIVWKDSNMRFFGHDAEIERQAAGELVPIPMM